MKLKRSTLFNPFLSRRNHIVTTGDPHYRFTHTTVEQYNDIIPGLKLYWAYKDGRLHFKVVVDHYVDCKTFEYLMWGIVALQWPNGGVPNYSFSGISAADPSKCNTMEVHWGEGATSATGYSYTQFYSRSYSQITDIDEGYYKKDLEQNFPHEYSTMKGLRQLVMGGPVIGVYDDGYRGYNKAEVRFEFSERIDETSLPGYESDTTEAEPKVSSAFNTKTIIIIAAVALAAFLILKK
jgi:hypothetical protein